MTVILILVAAAGAALLASVIMSRAANRPALWNMGLGGALAVAVLVCAALIAYAITRSMLPAGPPDRATSDRKESLTVKVLVLNFDPRIARTGGATLHSALRWNDPRDLANQYAADVGKASGGFITFEIVEWRDVDAFPRKIDGFVYTAEQYLTAHGKRSGWHQPDAADYVAFFREFGVVSLIDAGTIDELWVFGGPYFGYSEAAMAGRGAFDINGPVLADVPSKRPFAIMGFNYERGVAEMLENLCHRLEATMTRQYGGWRIDELGHDWARFAANEAQSGTAAVGTCHWPPNAEAEYDFRNPRIVPSTADDWLSYPRLTGRLTPVNRDKWGGPDYARNYLFWWLRHLPRAPGVAPDGRHANWWKYVFDFGRQPRATR